MKLPPKHKLAQRAEHAFHGSYLAFEGVLGHPPLSWLALGILVCILAEALFHFYGGE